MWGFIFPNSSVWARSSTTCLNTPNYFPLHCRIACTLLTHHVLVSTPFNMFVAFPALTIVIERPLFCLAANFIIVNSLVVLRWTKWTPQSDPIHNKLDSHEDLAWRRLSWLLNSKRLAKSFQHPVSRSHDPLPNQGALYDITSLFFYQGG